MPATDINFKYIRQNADIARVVEDYGYEVTKDGSKPGQFKCQCPFHDDTNPSLKINTDRNIFKCFVCDEGGNVIDFVVSMDDVDLRTAAKKVADISSIPYSDKSESANGYQQQKRKPVKPKRREAEAPKKSQRVKEEEAVPAAEASPEPEPVAEEEMDGVPYNPPLSFTLKNMQKEHPFFEERGLTKRMIDSFDLGIATRGMMKDRLAFPIHNASGKLVAYCGRWVDEDRPEDEPKYKFPPQFRKDLELYNWWRYVGKDSDFPIVLVESFLSVVKMFPDYPVISPMGRSMSDTQIQMLHDEVVSRVILLFDGDDPGRAAVTTIGRQLLEKGFEVKAPVVPEDFKPHKASPEMLAEILGEYF